MNIVKVKDSIFREYDIRGIWKEDIDEDVAYTIGRSFGSKIEEKKVIVGYDNRVSSPILHEALTKGLMESGVDVTSLGLVTTPMYYYAKKKNKFKNGIMITASHNPKEYNGFKISFDYIGNSCGQTIYDFRDYTNNGVFIEKQGTINELDIKKDYLNLIRDSISLNKSKKLKVVVDCGNGTGSIIIKDIMELFDIETYYLYCESNPEFPNHQPDPAVKDNQISLSNKVKELGYDFGFSVDGDADRVGIVDEKGNILLSDIYITLMYKYLAPTIKHKKAIYDVKCSKVLIDELDKLGYTHTMYRTGNSYMNEKINKDEYDFGGEFSGHVWFRDKFPGFDDGIYAGLRVIELLTNINSTLSEYLKDLNSYYSTEELKVKTTEDKKFNIVSKVKDYCNENGYKYNDIDGVRVLFDDAWALIRASNTGPNLILRFESKTQDRLYEIQNEFTYLVNALL